MTTSRLVAALCALAAIAGAQTTITNTYPAVVGFVDLETNGGTNAFPLFPPSNNSSQNIFPTIGNPLFPAGIMKIANDGAAIAGVASGSIASTNAPIPTGGFPAGIPSGAAAILPFWDDLIPTTPFGGPAATIWWKEAAGVLYILWKGEYHVPSTDGTATISFEIQVFAAPGLGAPWIQILYPDAIFSAFPVINACDGGACATIGYVAGPSFGNNVQWSFDTASVPSGTVLSIFHNMGLTPSSPLGLGSIMLDFSSGPHNGSYFFAVTLTQGSFPNGWLFGLDITYAELTSELAAGFPFTGPLDAAGNNSLGPFQGLPPLTLYTLAFGFPPGSPVPTLRSNANSYAIP